MFRTTLKDLSARKLRLLTTSIAVLLGVAFMAGTLVLTDTIGQTFDDLFADVNSGTDAYVRGEAAFEADELGGQRARLDESLADTIGGVDGVAVAAPSIQAYAQIVDKDGEPMGDPEMGAPTYGANWLADDDLNPFDLAAGRAPEAADEVVIDQGSAKAAGYQVGDDASVLTQAGEQAVTIVGIATFGGTDSPGGASFALFTLDAAETYLTAPGKVDAIKVVAADGVSDEQVVERIAQVVPDQVEVLTGAEITAEDQSDIKEGLGFFNTFLLTFALIALFVGSFIIYNSFSILVAQRGRDMALLRAIGASRRQVLGSVLLEAVVVGLIASVVGLAAGVGVASGLKVMLTTMGIDIPAGGIVLTSSTVVISLIAGLGVSIASALLPARRASRVAPVAAMRDVAVDSSGSSRRRAVIGTVVTALGGAAIAQGLFAGGDAALMAVGLGVALVFLGVAVLGPILARPAQPGARLAAAPPQGHVRHARPGERHAQPQADLGHGRRAHDRCRPRRLHHHPRLLDEGVDRRQPRQLVQGRSGDRLRHLRRRRARPAAGGRGRRAARGGGRQRPPQRGRRGRRLQHDDRGGRPVDHRGRLRPGRHRRRPDRPRGLRDRHPVRRGDEPRLDGRRHGSRAVRGDRRAGAHRRRHLRRR